jgi:hypothetical protein
MQKPHRFRCRACYCLAGKAGAGFLAGWSLGIPCHLSGLHMHFHVQRQEFCSERV